jgi:hypothetical protein
MLLLTFNSLFSQDINHDFKKNTIKLSQVSNGFSGLSFKLNYERNVNRNLILFGSYYSSPDVYKSAGLGIKYRIFTYKKFEGILGAELAYSKFDLPTKSKTLEFKPSAELRYNFNKNLFMSLDWARNGYGTGFDVRSRCGIGIGLKF